MAGFSRLVRRIAGVLLIFVFLTYENSMHTDATGVRRETQVGAWFSPWYTTTETTTQSAAATADGGKSESSTTQTTTKFTLASWSWPILAAALALLFWPSRKPPAEKTAPSGPPPSR